MTDLYGSNYSKANIQVPAVKAPIGDIGGRKRVSIDTHTFVGEILTTDKLLMNKIPIGAKITNVTISHPDLGTTGLFNVGWGAGKNGNEAADADGFFAAMDVKTAAGKQSMAQSAAGNYKDFADECDLEIVPTENTDAAIGLTIIVEVEYVIE